MNGGVCGIREVGFRVGYMRLAVRTYRKVGREWFSKEVRKDEREGSAWRLYWIGCGGEAL